MPGHAFPFRFPIFFIFCRSHCLNLAHSPVFQRRLISRHRIRRSVPSFFVNKGRPNRTQVDIDGISSGGFLPNSLLRPENKIHHIRFFAKAPANQLESTSVQLEHDTLSDKLREENRPGSSEFDLGDSVVIEGHGLDKNDAIFHVERIDRLESKREGQCACRLSTAWSFDTMINSIRSTVEVDIQTSETRTSGAKTAGGSASETAFPGDSKTAVSMPFAEDSMHGLHQTLIDRLKDTKNVYSQALASQLAKLAYLLSEKSSTSSRLMAVSIGISTYQIGVHNTTANMKYALSRSEFESFRQSPAQKLDTLNDHLVYVALGSNVGDRIAMLDSACRELDRCGIRVARTSALYETEPMYLQEQRSFVNGACEVRTTLKPLALLDKLKEIETALGRQKTVENGPRAIDLDILLYDETQVDHERLIIPHKRILEREFVLRPLCDLIPEATLPSPLNSATFSVQLLKLPKPQSPLSPLTPLSPKAAPISSLSPTRPTHIMAILNLTPDSFSDGNLHPTDPDSILPTLEEFLSAGVSILDIGGQSTRPHAPQISAEEEIARVLPTIKFIRSQPAFDTMAISIDTYRASVADAAISAGANIVNDISAGQMDSRMLPKIAELGCTVILMHMRGTPATMTTLTEYPSGVLDGVGSELSERVAEAEKAGIRRWRIILDPGIGFAKNEPQNLELLRHLGTLRQYQGLQGLPWTVGASRKRFIGKITGVQTPRERSWGTAATVSAAIQGGADIVRVHDAIQMAQVARMSDAIWRF